jgi:hypothetical protein
MTKTDTYDRPDLSSERAPQKGQDNNFVKKKSLVKSPRFGLDTKTYWLTDRQSQCDFDLCQCGAAVRCLAVSRDSNIASAHLSPCWRTGQGSSTQQHNSHVPTVVGGEAGRLWYCWCPENMYTEVNSFFCSYPIIPCNIQFEIVSSSPDEA